jgi:hypothetical protein
MVVTGLVVQAARMASTRKVVVGIRFFMVFVSPQSLTDDLLFLSKTQTLQR